MFLLPCIYIFSFALALYRIFHNRPGSIVYFFVLGLPIYFTALSISYKDGLEKFIPVLQSFKEIVVLLALGCLLINRKKKVLLQPIDKLVLGYLIFNLVYALIPLGNFNLLERLLAFKSLCFFPFVYFTGRLMDPDEINLNKYFSYVCLVAMLASVVLIGEVITNEHLQIYTGYSAFNEKFFGQEPGGNYGLSWTFETSNGIKRFASFFSEPLELGANTLFTMSVIIGLATDKKNKIVFSPFILTAFLLSLVSIFFAFSRASFASYFIIIYLYAVITKRKTWLNFFNFLLLAALIFILYLLSGDVYDFIINTIDFSDSSSAFHVLQWLEGLDAMAAHPLGLGMGMSGRVAATDGNNIGGENQFIITGVQIGILGAALYLFIYIYIMHTCMKVFKNSDGKKAKLALILLLTKAGLIVPMLTANVESYVYIMYITWFCSGLLVSMTAYNEESATQLISSTHLNTDTLSLTD